MSSREQSKSILQLVLATAVGAFERVKKSWANLDNNQRLAFIASLVLLLSFFLPWYQKTYGAIIKGNLQQASNSVSAFGSFSFIEASIFIVALATVFLLLARGEKRNFDLPGGDGVALLISGGWTTLLVLIRVLFDKPDPASNERAVTIGIQWGIFVALISTATLAYLGWRMRQHTPPKVIRSVNDPGQQPMLFSLPEERHSQKSTKTQQTNEINSNHPEQQLLFVDEGDT